jgi:acetyltransferase-like isoleucine patch superfamily enzyme
MSMFEPLQRGRRRIEAALALFGCDRVGSGALVVGHPKIVNEGRISIGDGFHFTSEPVTAHLFAERGGIIEIGNDVSIGHGSGIAARGRIRIGNGSRLGAFVLAMDTDYHVAGDTTATKEAEITPIEIGAGVRIGNRVTILRGAVIGDGATILDGSVVIGDVPAGARVAGVPARSLRSVPREDSDEGVELRVRRVAQATFRLIDLPVLALGPAELEAWDSLGTLSFLLALEEEFSVPLGEDEMRDVRTLADATRMISSALARI